MGLLLASLDAEEPLIVDGATMLRIA